MRTPPNILLLVSDQQRPDLLGCLGTLPVRTPRLDALAREGTLFTRAYTPCPLCTPARASLLTGQYPSRHGAWSIGVDTPTDALSLPALLASQANYATGIIGKSHFMSCQRSDSPEALPRSRDWEHFRHWRGPWYGFEHARICVGHGDEPHAHSMHYGLWLRDRGIEPVPPYFHLPSSLSRPNQNVGRWALPEDRHSNAWILEETHAFLADHTNQKDARPFFLSVNFPDPHVPFKVPAPWDSLHDDVILPPPCRRFDEVQGKPTLYRATLEGNLDALGWHQQAYIPSLVPARTDRQKLAWTPLEEHCWRIYLGMQSQLDHYVGRILDALESVGLADNTLVVYTSDHGDLMGDHWLQYKGGCHYHAAVGVPMIVRWPQRVPAGRRHDALQSLVDLPATFLHAAGLARHPRMQGTDQLDVWTGRATRARSGVWIDHRVEQGLTVNSWITATHRLSLHSIHSEARTEWELYDLVNDPDEYTNLAADPATGAFRAELLAELINYQGTITEPAGIRTTYS
ncbi:MAG: sulfatase-like hydrolase/transferase [Opitutaceae bacterium]